MSHFFLLTVSQFFFMYQLNRSIFTNKRASGSLIFGNQIIILHLLENFVPCQTCPIVVLEYNNVTSFKWGKMCSTDMLYTGAYFRQNYWWCPQLIQFENRPFFHILQLSQQKYWWCPGTLGTLVSYAPGHHQSNMV